ncbi:MAG: L-threonylcarbamoyladenylate synthase [Enterobacterales bacterium]|nr:L-threonylcarbamoyladenylate synthase [Enterobacterales bacterium]
MTSRWKIVQATRALKQGGVIIYPTESIFGIGCDAADLAAVNRLLDLKQRSFNKGLILLVSDISQIERYIQPLTSQQLALINGPQPRATTWLLAAQKHVSPLIKGLHPKLAVRITRHPIAKALCQQLGNPIVSTSCNKSGKPVSVNAAFSRNHWLRQVDHVIAGECGGQPASQIIDLESGKVIRN